VFCYIGREQTKMVLGGGEFVRWFDHEGRAFINKISALKNRGPRELSRLSHHSEKVLSMNWKWVLTRQQICWCLHPGFLSSRPVKNEFLLFVTQFMLFL
jgi:hypothetical protein